MFLQAGNSIINSVGTEKKLFSLWDMLFSGGTIGNIFLVIIFILGILSLYVFFERYFFIERAAQGAPNLLENIKDCIHEGRIEAAVDFCKDIDSPEARMAEKGMSRLGRPITDISLAMQHQGQIEINHLLKRLNFLILTTVMAPMIGLLGTVAGIIVIFFKLTNTSADLLSNLMISGIYNSLPAVAAGLTIGIVVYFLYYVLMTKVDEVKFKIQQYENDFLEAINKPL